MKNISFIFFGTPDFAVTILNELKTAGFLPTLIVTQEDKPQGRHLVLTPPPVKVWADAHNIAVLQPKTLKGPEVVHQLSVVGCELFVVCAYGKIIPQNILDIPKYQTLNVHPSLLPILRGSAPIQGAILREHKTGVTIMRLDSEMDHGPIVAQKEITSWDESKIPYEEELETLLAHAGGEMLAEVIPKWIEGTVTEVEQDHTKATYIELIKKSDAEIDLSADPKINLRKIRAYHRWPKAFTYIEDEKKRIRVIITTAHIEGGTLILEKVIPEGKKEMSWDDFKRGLHLS